MTLVTIAEYALTVGTPLVYLSQPCSLIQLKLHRPVSDILMRYELHTNFKIPTYLEKTHKINLLMFDVNTDLNRHHFMHCAAPTWWAIRNIYSDN